MEDIDSSKESGSSTSAGTRFFRSSTVRVGLEVDVGVEVKAGRVDVNSWPNGVDARCGGGVSNLTVGFVYGRERLRNET